MRIVAFITLLVLSTLVPWPVLLILAGAYVLIWTGYELVFGALLIDAYFGATILVPHYTITAVALLCIAEWLKPRLLLYNTEYR